MRQKHYLLYIVICFAYTTSAQITPAVHIQELIKKAHTLSTQNIDSALYFANYAVQLAEKLDSPTLIFDAYRAVGIINEDNNHLTDAQKAYIKALALADNKLTTKEQFMIYTDWAIIHKKLGQYKIALDYHLLTVTRAEKEKNWEVVEEGYHGLGTLYSMLSDFNQANYYYLLSVQAAEKWGNTEGVVLTQQNISNIYMKAKNYEMALKNVENTYQMALKLGDSTRIAAVLGVYGNIETAVGNYPNALAKHLEAKGILEKTADKKRLTKNYMSIGYIYFQQKKYEQADNYYTRCKALKDFFDNYVDAEFHNKLGQLYEAKGQINDAILAFNASLNVTNAFGFKEIAKENHVALAEIYNKNKQFDKAYQESISVNELNEVLFKETNQKSMTEAQFKFDVEKRDLQIKGQNKQLVQSRIIGWLLIGGLVLMSGLSFFSWLQMREKQKAYKRIELIIKELHHRVKNNIQTIASMMRLQARQISDPTVKAVLLENKSRLETFSMLHQQLYQTDDVQEVDLKPFISGIIDKLLMTYSIYPENIKTHITVENKLLDVETAIPIGLILNELLTNSFKYAYHSVDELAITIDISSKRFQYADNGQSLPKDFNFDKSTGFGTDLIKSFSQQLKGKYRFRNANGFHFELVY